jgi:Arc/MetJ-type ribon-helix-helix transcriptional regulator
MVNGMATRKITVTLDEDAVRKVQALVASGQASSVSGFVQRAVVVALGDAAGWAAMLAGALEQTGGPLSKAERAWAQGIVFPSSRKTPRRRRRAA